MIQIDIPPNQIRELQAALAGTGKKLPREIAIAINATTTKVLSVTGKEIGKELATPQKAIKAVMKKGIRASAKKLGSKVTIKETERIPLRDFRHRELKRGGVSYKISKSKGTRKAPDAFIVDRYKKHVYKRRGKPRGPLVMLKGASPWGVYVKRRLDPQVRKVGTAELSKQIDKRIRFILLKKSGAI